jgi:hypothetical protein
MNELKSAGASWLRASISAVAALYMSGISDPKVLVNAFFAGLLAPAAKFLNPKDAAYGFGKK